ncbi:hypothetical protein [Bacillus taeanensis]|uniref:Uncharacterized protein n=1 Tax=Bacillus taeanensis TaxID=273032 RepID=A0A366Y1V3_9BACI|nr:hypothetical protein [Bacillus taeanensis]RBW70181.1 hypothetical protein DS031_08310 [Bacillus taeanensis]
MKKRIGILTMILLVGMSNLAAAYSGEKGEWGFGHMMGGYGFGMMGYGLIMWLLHLLVIGVVVYFSVKLALKSK